MYKVVQAIYRDGQLFLSEKLSSTLEGKQLNIIVLDPDGLEQKKERFFDFVDKQTITLPRDYQFNRDALYER
jgi:hypothetical protein